MFESASIDFNGYYRLVLLYERCFHLAKERKRAEQVDRTASGYVESDC